MTHEEYMLEAFREAFKGVRGNEGGPFGAIIVLNGEVIGRGCNRVTSMIDPTAHAEVVAIREACQRVRDFHLSEAAMYATCEPCPMCLSAIYWAGIKTVYYSADRHDAAEIGFNDSFIYDELNKPVLMRYVSMKQLVLPEAESLFDEWADKEDKTLY